MTQDLRLHKIVLGNFRNYTEYEIDFHKQYIFIIGPNASGKSNLLEAIEYISVGGEVNRESEKQILAKNASEDFFSIKANYELMGRQFQLEAYIGQRQKNIKVNGIKYRSINAIEESMKAVIFKSRESLEMIRGNPLSRRNWLNMTLNLINKSYEEALKRYERLIEQRNNLFKNSLEKGNSLAGIESELNIWEIEISKYGNFIQKTRKAFFNSINEDFQLFYNQISDLAQEKTNLTYLPNPELEEDILNPDLFYEKLKDRRKIDFYRGQTSVGPHRDDFLISIDNQEARHFSSQGQQRTSALSLKLIQLKQWEEKLEFSPILLLDDVSAELDLARQKALFNSLPLRSQVFITTTHLNNLPIVPNNSYQIINLK